MNSPNSSIVSADEMRDRKRFSYLLWLGMFVGVFGLHRLYNGKIVSGIIWFGTFGCFGLGQFIDLILIPDMAEDRIKKLASKRQQTLFEQPATVAAEVSQDTLTVNLLRLAKLHDGQLTVTQAVMETGQSFEKVEQTLKAMVKSGYADVTNRPDSGVVVYEFPELM
ncbi:MAG: TM2 domain-containing protein [Cyanobacteria bacterium P01_D01_bin.156]